MWHPCRYDAAETGHVEWTHLEFDDETWTCFHHGRTEAATLVGKGWIRVTEQDWYDELERETQPA